MRLLILIIFCASVFIGCSSGRQFASLDPVSEDSSVTNSAAVAEQSAKAVQPVQPQTLPATVRLVSSTQDVQSAVIPPPAAPQDPEPPALESYEVAQPVIAVVGDFEPVNQSLTLAEAEQTALAYNPTLRQLQHQISAARGQWVQGGLKPNPVLSLTSQEIGNEGSAGQNGVSLSQQIVTADKLCLNQKVSAWDIRRNELLLQVQRQRLVTDIRKQFYVSAISQKRIEVAQQLLQIAAEGEEQARRLVQVQEPMTVLKQAQVETQLARIQVQNARIKAAAEWNRLANLMGQPTLQSQPLVIDIASIDDTLDFESVLQGIFATSPERAAAVAAQERAAWAVRRACAGATPNLQIQGGAFHDDSSDDTFANVQLSIPLTIHNVNQGNIMEARAKLSAAVANVRRVEQAIRQRLITAVQQYESSVQQWRSYENDILPTAQETLELTKAAFLSGDASYLPVLTAQRSYSEVQLASLQSQQQLGLAKAQIDGQLLDGSL